MSRLSLVLAGAILAGACSSSTGPTPPLIEAPPKITCPAAQTIQLTANAMSVVVTYASPTTIDGRLPVTTACTPPSGSSFGVGTTSVSCTATDALHRSSTCPFVITVLAPVAPPTLAATSFFAFGDSITAGDDGRNSSLNPFGRVFPTVQLPDAQTYPGVLLQSLLDRYTVQSPGVRNQGASGEAVTDPGTVSRFDGLASSRQYQAVLIMEGTNDLHKAHDAPDAASKDAILGSAAAGLRQMVVDAKRFGLRPLLATIPPMNPAGSRGSVYGADLVSSFNDRITSVATAEHITLVDVHQAFGANLSLLGSDGVHPNANGYATIAGAFFDAIKNTLEIKTSSASSERRR